MRYPEELARRILEQVPEIVDYGRKLGGDIGAVQALTGFFCALADAGILPTGPEIAALPPDELERLLERSGVPGPADLQ